MKYQTIDYQDRTSSPNAYHIKKELDVLYEQDSTVFARFNDEIL